MKRLCIPLVAAAFFVFLSLSAQAQENFGVIYTSTDGGSSWTHTEFYDIGHFYCFVEDTDGAIITGGAVSGFKASRANLIYRSTDQGATWNAIGTPTDAERIYDILLASDGNLYATVTPPYASKIARVDKSTDHGTTWTPTGALPRFGTNRGLAYGLMQASNGYFYVGYDDGYGDGRDEIARSTNFGASWAQMGDLDGYQFWTILEDTADGNFYVTSNIPGLINRSTDGGFSWELTEFSQPPMPEAERARPLIKASDGYLYAGTGLVGIGPNEAWIYKTNDAGDTWSHVVTLDSGTTGMVVEDIQEPTPGTFLAAVSGGPSPTRCVFKSTDGGATWPCILQAPGSKMTDSGRAIVTLSMNAVFQASDGTIYAGGQAGRGAATGPLNGTYIINNGGSGDYSSFAEAVSDLEDYGVDGSVTFNVYDDGGTYSEQVGGASGINSISGASASNYVRFKPADSGENVTINGDSYGIHIRGGSYIEFLEFHITSTTSYGVYLHENASYNVIKGCTIDGVGGSASVYLNAARYNIIQGNTIEAPGGSSDSCIYGTNGARDTEIHNNNIYGVGTTGYGITFYDFVDDNVISSNRIHGLDIGIYTYAASTHSNDSIIFNNMIYDCLLGIWLRGSAPSLIKNPLVYFNSILSTKAFQGNACDSPNIRNNIFSCAGDQASSDFAISLSNCTPYGSGVTSDYNDLWAPYGYIGYWEGTPYSTLATWRSASSEDANSVSSSPHYTSTTDLHLFSSSQCINAGVAISGYIYDFDGETRGSPPDIGADENPGGALFVDFVLFDAQVQGRDVLITWTTAEEIEAAGFYLWRSDGAGEYEKITVDPIPAQGGPLFGADYTYLDSGLMVGQTYEYRLEAVNIYGQSQYEGPVAVTVGALCGAMVPSAKGYVLFALALLFVPALIVRMAKKR